MNEQEVSDLSSDIYYQRAYSALYEDNCEYFEFLYEEGLHFVKFSALKHRIIDVSGIKLEEELYDLETPYGYGGPLTNSIDKSFLQRAFEEIGRASCRERV